jgi:DNA-binding transcriptional LysR family regulator
MERRMNFDIDCLRSFLVVADTMSFSRAAESVGRSQSTVSQQIAKLETQIGKNLLTRRKGRVIELTSEGGKLVLYARRMLQLNDEAYASMSDEVLTGHRGLCLDVRRSAHRFRPSRRSARFLRA